MARAYLHPARARGRIDLATRVRVTRVVFEGRRAVGVEYVRDGAVQLARAGRAVIISAGAFNSPQLLKLSGVGPADELRRHGIGVVADLAGVGENLQDHLDFLLQYRCLQPVSYNPATRGLGRLAVGLRWLATRGGIGASNIWETGSFFRTRPDVPYPNMQHHFAPVAINYDGSGGFPGHGFQLHLSQMRPLSRGSVRLRSADPFAPPVIRFNHFAEEADRIEVREGLRISRELVAQRAFDHYRGDEMTPGAGVTSDAQLDAFARAGAETSHHPGGTCRMGLDELAVTDADGCVHGVEALRVVDASLMPAVVTANLNATVIMMAEKLADRIKGRQPLPPETP